jgi:hypothetical protein
MLKTLQSGSWVWVLTLLIFFPATQPQMQLKVKPAILTKIFTKLIQEGQAGLSLMTNRLGRQLQGRRVPHESDQLELQGLGREPPKLLTNKRRIPLRSASVRTYTFFTMGFSRFLSIRGARGLQAFDLPLHTSYSNPNYD